MGSENNLSKITSVTLHWLCERLNVQFSTGTTWISVFNTNDHVPSLSATQILGRYHMISSQHTEQQIS